MSMLKAKSITAGYGELDVLFDISVGVERGDLVAVIGPNGAGKSTFLRTIAGVLKPRKGSISFKNKNITGIKAEKIVRMGLSWVPQDDHVFHSLTVGENLKMGAYTQKTGYQKRLNEVCFIFPQLKKRMKQVAGSLSGGQQQMVAVGRGLMSNPELLLLDEPTSGLAPNLVQTILNKIQEINKAGVTVLLVAQALQAFKLSNYGYVLAAGELKFSNPTEELLANTEVRDLCFSG